MAETVLFVCPHGAGKSRVAAAWFNGSAPPGWQATSAGVTPQETVSEHAPRLLAGTRVEQLLDTARPRELSAVPDPALVVAIDCPAGSVAGAAISWQLENGRFDDPMADELRVRAEALARSIAGDHGMPNGEPPPKR